MCFQVFCINNECILQSQGTLGQHNAIKYMCYNVFNVITSLFQTTVSYLVETDFVFTYLFQSNAEFSRNNKQLQYRLKVCCFVPLLEILCHRFVKIWNRRTILGTRITRLKDWRYHKIVQSVMDKFCRIILGISNVVLSLITCLLICLILGNDWII